MKKPVSREPTESETASTFLSTPEAQSGVGLASFLLALFVNLAITAALVLVVSGAFESISDSLADAIGAAVLMTGLLATMGLALGIAGLMERAKRRLHAKWGLGMSIWALLLVGGAGLFGWSLPDEDGFSPLAWLWEDGTEETSPALFPVVVDGEWGYIDQAGILVVEPQFAYARPFSEDLALVNLGGKA